MESIRYHLELTPAQLKVTYTALRSLLDGLGDDEPEVHAIIHELLAKLPDEQAIRAIRLELELDREGDRDQDADPGPEPPGPSAA